MRRSPQRHFCAWRLLAVAFAVVLLAPQRVLAVDRSVAVKNAKAYLESLAEDAAPGCAAGVYDIRSNRWIIQHAFGLADLKTGRAIKPNAVFGVASVTKQFTAAATAIAAIEGKLSLDDKVRSHIPEMPKYGADITIRDLISHTHGLRDIGRLTMLTGRPQDYLSQHERIDLLVHQAALNFSPGDDYRYGNSGYLLLAEIIERATGMPFANYVDRVIFRPLQMKDSYFGTATRGGVDRALPYSLAGDSWRNDDAFFSGDGEWGHQGLMATLEDYAKWVSNLYADDSKLAGGAQLTAMLRSQASKRDGSLVPYGFGLRFDVYKGHATIGHGGSNLGYKTHTMIFPQRRIAVLGFCNHGRYAQPMVMRLADIILDLNDGEARDAEVLEYSLSSEALINYVGDYREPSLRLPMFVEATEGGLLVSGDVVPSLFKPIAATRFRNDHSLEIVFRMDSEGRAQALVQSDGRQYGTGRFERIERVTPSADDLVSYSGDYYSDELGATYRFGLDNGKLTVRILNGDVDSPVTLVPMLEDEFVSLEHRLAIRFQGQEQKPPTTMTLTYQFGWIADLLFQRLDD